MDLPLNRLGTFRVEVTAPVGPDNQYTRSEKVFSLLPLEEPSRQQLAQSSYGIHAVNTPYHLEIVDRLGVGWLRMMDMTGTKFTLWMLMEPSSGQLRWRDDLAAVLHDEHHLSLLGVLFKSPLWATSVPESLKQSNPHLATHQPPRSMQQWGNYVARVADHYQSRVRHWEVWNEPWSQGFGGRHDLYVELLRTAYQQAKTADPNCLILGGCMKPNNDWGRLIIERGALDYMDILSFHVYNSWGLNRTLSQERGLAEIRQWMEARGQVKPLWDTESGVLSPSLNTSLRGASGQNVQEQAPSCAEAAATLLRVMLTNTYAGVERSFYYYLAGPNAYSGEYHNWNLLGLHGAVKPMAAAYAQLIHLTAEAQPVSALEVAQDWRAVVWQSEAGSLAALWHARAAAKAEVPALALPRLDQPVEILDLMGNLTATGQPGQVLGLTVTGEPVYLRSAAEPQALRELLANAEVAG